MFTTEKPEQDCRKAPEGGRREEELRLREKGYEHCGEFLDLGANQLTAAGIKSHISRKENACARCPAQQAHNHGDFGAADHVMAPETTSTIAA
ncbi:hypothetical protein, partial [Mesorhizobium sp. M7A.F.Ca.CA.004.12.1.1]|uniref:hypothetical protein n=1 Tax=Mesorhizobium sp. M7A.F.Ca.CA.004.12.1.1 TaxID=2496732 RepID=UPI0019D25812